MKKNYSVKLRLMSLFAIEGALKIPPKCETKVLSENGNHL
jgi:hypothetical protein